jgi:hypothetical protein
MSQNKSSVRIVITYCIVEDNPAEKLDYDSGFSGLLIIRALP